MSWLTYFDRYEPANVGMSRLISLDVAGKPEHEDADILCLGCSTGQTSLDLLTELYVELDEISDGVKRRVHMVSLDIQPSLLEVAREGKYNSDPVQSDLSKAKVLRAPWMEFNGRSITTNWDTMRDLGWSLDYRQFDVDKDLRLACPNREKGFDIVELMNCHNEKRDAEQVENVGRVLKHGGLMSYGSLPLEYSFFFCKEDRILPKRIPRSIRDFVKTCDSKDALLFMTGATGSRPVTAEESLLLAQSEYCDIILPNSFIALQVLETYYILKRFSDYLYGLKDADESEKRHTVESNDMMRYLHGYSMLGDNLPSPQGWALELYRKTEDPEKQKNFWEFVELSKRTE